METGVVWMLSGVRMGASSWVQAARHTVRCLRVCLRLCLRIGLWPLCALLLAAPAAAGNLGRAELQALLPPPLLLGERSPGLPAWPVFRQDGAALVLQGHVFETIDLEPVAGYGGRPVNLLVLLDRDGVFLDVRLLSHAEPLFASPQGTAVLAAFAQQYRGLSLQHDIQVLSASAERTQTDTRAGLHGVMAGTVSALAIDRAVLESAAQLAHLRARADAGQAAQPLPRGPNDRYRKTGWNELVRLGLVQPWRLSNKQVQAGFDNGPAAWRDPGGRSWPDGPAVDIWVALASLPQAGRNLFDAAGWQAVRAAREQGQTVLLVLDGGRYPVAGAAPADAARAAVLQLRQQGRSFALQPLPWAGTMALSGTRSGVPRDAVPRLFTVAPAADGSRLDAEQPLDLVLAVQRGGSGSGGGAVSGAGGGAFGGMSGGASGGTPAATLAGPEAGTVVSAPMQRPFAVPDVASYRPQAEPPAWRAAWGQRAVDLAVLAAGLAVLVVALARQAWLTAQPGRLAAFRTAYLVFTLGFVGWWAQGQLTVVSITAAIEAGVAGRGLDFLLTDPVAVLLWAFTGVTLLVWGRGTFCGWLCPFGALQELASQLARRLGLRQRPLHRRLDQRLKWLKYGVLGLLCSGAALSAGWTDAALEVEPFKTAISQYFQRDWPYVVWALVCVGAGTLVFRG
ncbi:MAG: 4Fe-4S binding protein, partial [Aquabacterium sp.]|nr:4Fe-4S binding protein [Aquabacterium sp.]